MKPALAFVILCAASGCDGGSSSSNRPPPSGPPPPGWYGPPPAGPAPGGPPSSGPALRPDEISQVVNASYPSFTSCYQRSESYMIGKSGNVTIFFDVAPAGHVTRATDQPPPGVAIQGTPLYDPGLIGCLATAFRALRFRTASEATAASWLFTFSP